MTGYLIQFGIYTLAMVGVIFVCLLVAKKTMSNGRFAKNTQELCIENVLNLTQRKSLYVIKAGEEKFLIAADAERTSFLAKLNDNKTPCVSKIEVPADVQTAKTIDYSEVLSSLKKTKKPVLREMVRKLNEQKA